MSDVLTEIEEKAILDNLRELLIGGAREVQKAFNSPDDDWIPVMMIAGEDDQSYLVGFDPAFLENEQTKDELAKAVVQACQMYKATGVAMLMSAWAIERPSNTSPKASPAPSECEDRQEKLLVHCVSRTQEWVGWADITRDGENPPELGELEEMENAESGGRFAEALQEGLR